VCAAAAPPHTPQKLFSEGHLNPNPSGVSKLKVETGMVLASLKEISLQG